MEQELDYLTAMATVGRWVLVRDTFPFGQATALP